jgi:predicted amidophosphoribosyltransferase
MAGFCGTCGAPRLENARFCTGCGADLSTMPVPCPTCGQPWVPPVHAAAVHSDESTFPSPVPTFANPQPSVIPGMSTPPVPQPTQGLPRGPELGEGYIPEQDCGNCGVPLNLQDGTCSMCGSRNTGPTFNPALMS